MIFVPWSESREDADRLCRAALVVLRGVADTASIDAYSDYRDRLPPEVEAAQARLRRIRPDRGDTRGDIGMGIDVSPDDDDEWGLAETYVGWSIHMDVRRDGEPIATLHDCGLSVWVSDKVLTEEAIASLKAAGRVLDGDHEPAAAYPHEGPVVVIRPRLAYRALLLSGAAALCFAAWIGEPPWFGGRAGLLVLAVVLLVCARRPRIEVSGGWVRARGFTGSISVARPLIVDAGSGRFGFRLETSRGGRVVVPFVGEWTTVSGFPARGSRSRRRVTDVIRDGVEPAGG